jgi:hypothetical protein
MPSPVLFKFTIYTIAHDEKLAKAATADGATHFSELKAWKSGYRLWRAAKTTSATMPIVFADATDCSRLRYWGYLTRVKIEGDITRYSVKRLRKILGRHTPQELSLRSTGKHIAEGFIRPYAICRTPSFLGGTLR